MSDRKIIEDAEFYRLASEAQHEEFINVMRDLRKVLEILNDNTEIEIAVNRLNNTILGLIENGVKVNTDALTKAIRDVILAKTKQEKKDTDGIEQWKFTIHRNASGYADSITAIKF